MPQISVFSHEAHAFNTLRVDVGSNCPQGGDSGHGGRTLLRLTNLASTDMRVAIDGNTYQDVESVSLAFGGDSECDTLIECLEFALARLKQATASTQAPQSTEDLD